MTKIEPAVKLRGKHKNGEFSGEVLELYSKEQMRQLGEACAAVCNDADKSTHPSDLADAIRNLIKEMLG